jgi:hypothetical protein
MHYSDAENDNGVPGQNSPTPAEKAFTCHYLQKLHNLYYDPSYGLTYTDALDFERRAVDGYGKEVGVQLYPPRTVYEVKPATGAGEIKIEYDVIP